MTSSKLRTLLRTEKLRDSTRFCELSITLEIIFDSIGISSGVLSVFIMVVTRSPPNRRIRSSSSDR